MPQPQTVWVLHIAHENAHDITLHATAARARAAVAAYARFYWDQLDESADYPAACAGLSDEEVVRLYFAHAHGESYSIDGDTVPTT